MEILDRIGSCREKNRNLAWEGTFGDYLELVIKNPQITRSAHSRVYDMVSREGWEEISEGKKYRFFAEELFGIESTLQILVEDYLKPAALGLDTKNRILLLMGPVGTGKSTIVNLIKRGLEEYSGTAAGALYGIKGCPMQEEPLHLVPQELRGELEKLGIRIEGSLCPRCRMTLEQDFKGEIQDVPVERVFFSEERRVGIGTFAPSDPKSQDIAELTGSLDFSTIGEYGTESHPRAYRFDGELNRANRGVMEFQELLKCDEKFLYNLLSLAQEGNFKAGRFALISADELVMGHTNRVEYEEFVREGRHEALKSRLFVIPVPYNLKLSQEERIYKKLLDRSKMQDIHLAPYALRTAAMFSILTRLQEPQSQGVDLIKKMYLYDGKVPGGAAFVDVEELKRNSPGEGMEGVDPRFVLNCISSALASAPDNCVSAVDILKALRQGLLWHPSIGEEERNRLEGVLLQVEREYQSLLRKDVSKACLECCPEVAEKIFNDYMHSVALYLRQGLGQEPGGEQIDTQLMERIEDHIQVAGYGRNIFREELLNRSARYAAVGRGFDFKSHPGLREAVEWEVIHRMAQQKADIEEGRAPKDVEPEELLETMVGKYGYCRKCAGEALYDAADMLL